MTWQLIGLTLILFSIFSMISIYIKREDTNQDNFKKFSDLDDLVLLMRRLKFFVPLLFLGLLLLIKNEIIINSIKGLIRIFLN